MNYRTLLATIAMTALVSQAAFANDTSVTLGAGGLEIAHSDAIEMLSEDLFISMDKIRVRYVFRNHTAKDVTTSVAFPLPDLKSDLQESPVDIPAPNSPNFVSFKTSVDGVETPLEVENKAIFKGVDRTADLKAVGAPLNPLLPDFSSKIQNLPPETRAKLKADELVFEDQIDQGKGWEPYWRPNWYLKTSFYRQQIFPAGKEITVEHEYRPVVGGTVAVLLNSPYSDAERRAQYRKDYCVNAKFLRAVKPLPENTQERWVSYILRTGANWSGPIKDFKLTVDKGAPQNLVSFCGWNVKRVSPTRFEMKIKNFTPKSDLNFLFITPNPQ